MLAVYASYGVEGFVKVTKFVETRVFFRLVGGCEIEDVEMIPCVSLVETCKEVSIGDFSKYSSGNLTLQNYIPC